MVVLMWEEAPSPPMAPPGTPEGGAVGELAGRTERHLNLSAWRAGWRWVGVFFIAVLNVGV